MTLRLVVCTLLVAAIGCEGASGTGPGATDLANGGGDAMPADAAPASDLLASGAADMVAAPPSDMTALPPADMTAPLPPDMTAPQDMTPPLPPRLIAPLSTSTVTSQQPIFKWTLPSGGTDLAIDVCVDRTCTNKLATTIAVDATGTSGAPTTALPPGLLYWRVSANVAGTPLTSATWEFTVGKRSASAANTSFGTTLDVNGDGFADVVIGAPGADGVNGEQQAGRAYAYLGSAAGLSTTPQELVGPTGVGSMFGRAVASAGDVNGDGFGDVIIGAWGTSDAGVDEVGRAYLYFGSALGLSSTPQVLTGGAGKRSEFGISVASAGDVNGDGYADVVVGALGIFDGNKGAGYIWLFLGGPDGVTASQKIAGLDGAQAFFGYALASGDINGDGYADVVVGAYLAHDAAGHVDAGRAYVFWGSATGLGATPQPLDGRDGVGAWFGKSVGSADVNGDGYADVIVGASRAGYGRAYLYLGGASGLDATPQALANPNHSVVDNFANVVGGVGDVDGDGFNDVVVGAYEAANSAGDTFVGRAYLYRGGTSGLDTTPHLLDPGEVSGARFGTSVAGAGDVNRDGFADVLVGAPGAYDDPASPSLPGITYLYSGGANGVGATPLRLVGPEPVHGPFGAEGQFGCSVASAFDVSGPRRAETT